MVYDLLNRRQTVHVTRHSGSDIKLSNKEVIVKDEATILKVLDKGNGSKTPKSNAVTQYLNSSHTIFRIVSKKMVSMVVSRSSI